MIVDRISRPDERQLHENDNMVRRTSPPDEVNRSSCHPSRIAAPRSRGGRTGASRVQLLSKFKCARGHLTLKSRDKQQNHLSLRLRLAFACFAHDLTRYKSLRKSIHKRTIASDLTDTTLPVTFNNQQLTPTTQNSQWYMTLLPKTTHAHAQQDTVPTAHPSRICNSTIHPSIPLQAAPNSPRSRSQH
jgi:hypothetical protein